MTYGQTQRRALLKRVAYYQGFTSNLVSWNLLKKNGWRWNTKANVFWRINRKIAKRVNFCFLLVTADQRIIEYNASDLIPARRNTAGVFDPKSTSIS
jgi:hypothetical protein